METIPINVESGIPLMGAIQFGIIPRSNNSMVQVRATTVCNLKCSFCSTCANESLVHPVHFVVDPDYLVQWFEHVAKLKGTAIEANIDSVGEPTAHPKLLELITKLHDSTHCSFISMQTNGSLLNESMIKKLEENGLNRINLSIHSLDETLSKKLMGNPAYDIKHVLSMARIISTSSIELTLAPVLIPGINENDMPKIIELSKELKSTIGIQKYEVYRHSRRIPKVKPETYWRFYERLKNWEKEFKIKLRLRKEDYKIKKTQELPLTFQKGDRVAAKIVCPGWYPSEMIGVAKERCITIRNCTNQKGDIVNVRIKENSDHIYLGELV
ncbi:molybdenum cofactor biosynthesis protein MoaA [archaeon]|nr:molybdenum cofactor biosynthesis protein MoaA [archaeon]|tara:strand:+ start:349 stop:1329 length:981 start_codon:yes stop_codon:yes gene_type:complete